MLEPLELANKNLCDRIHQLEGISDEHILIIEKLRNRPIAPKTEPKEVAALK
jgi:hypothetical protein